MTTHKLRILLGYIKDTKLFFNTAALLRTVTVWVYETTVEKVPVITWQSKKSYRTEKKKTNKQTKNIRQPNHSYRLGGNNWIEYDITWSLYVSVETALLPLP